MHVVLGQRAEIESSRMDSLAEDSGQKSVSETMADLRRGSGPPPILMESR